MNDRLSRIQMLVGESAMKRLETLRVAIFGVGGVGSVCAESLVRSGISNMTLVDSDCVCESNINRQLPAFVSTVGRPKVEILSERFLDINPYAKIRAVKAFYSPESRENFDFSQFDLVVDAIDSVPCKIDLLATAFDAHAKVFCSLGAAGKLDPTLVRADSIWKTKGCALGKLVRSGLRKRLFSGDFMAVYSEERPMSQAFTELVDSINDVGKKNLGSAMPVTAAFGLTLSSLVIRHAAGLL